MRLRTQIAPAYRTLADKILLPGHLTAGVRRTWQHGAALGLAAALLVLAEHRPRRRTCPTSPWSTVKTSRTIDIIKGNRPQIKSTSHTFVDSPLAHCCRGPNPVQRTALSLSLDAADASVAGIILARHPGALPNCQLIPHTVDMPIIVPTENVGSLPRPMRKSPASARSRCPACCASITPPAAMPPSRG